VEQNDEAVWQRVLTDDPRAFGILWDRHRDRIFRHLQAIGHLRDDAEDLTAVAFLELWRRRNAVRIVDGSMLPWLFVTARNVSRNAHRTRRRYERFLASLPAPEPVADPALSVGEADVLRRELAALRPADADLLVMTAIEGFTVHEAAQALGIGDSAAKMRLGRLRSRLRLVLTAPQLAEEGTS
jgi:RNA polymerase sigma-70 factor (ECF subfamily)